MENWKDYVGFQPVVLEAGETINGGLIFYLRCLAKERNSSLTFSVERAVLTIDQYVYSDGTIGYAVEIALGKFDTVDIPKTDDSIVNRLRLMNMHRKQLKWYSIIKRLKSISYLWKELPWFALQSKKNYVARDTRRGPANTNWKNVWFYNGKTVIDRPIIVSEIKGKYAIFMHPDFKKYGFKIKDDRK